MKKKLLCFLGFHKWEFITSGVINGVMFNNLPKLNRKCEICGRKQHRVTLRCMFRYN